MRKHQHKCLERHDQANQVIFRLRRHCARLACLPSKLVVFSLAKSSRGCVVEKSHWDLLIDDRINYRNFPKNFDCAVLIVDHVWSESTTPCADNEPTPANQLLADKGLTQFFVRMDKEKAVWVRKKRIRSIDEPFNRMKRALPIVCQPCWLRVATATATATARSVALGAAGQGDGDGRLPETEIIVSTKPVWHGIFCNADVALCSFERRRKRRK